MAQTGWQWFCKSRVAHPRFPFMAFIPYFIMLSGFIYRPVQFHICHHVSVHALWNLLMLLTLFAQLIYVSVLHWMVWLYYYGFLVNEGIGLSFVIQTFVPSALSVLYVKISIQPLSVWSTIFYLNIFKSYHTKWNTIISWQHSLLFYITSFELLYLYRPKLPTFHCSSTFRHLSL